MNKKKMAEHSSDDPFKYKSLQAYNKLHCQLFTTKLIANERLKVISSQKKTIDELVEENISAVSLAISSLDTIENLKNENRKLHNEINELRKRIKKS